MTVFFLVFATVFSNASALTKEEFVQALSAAENSLSSVSLSFERFDYDLTSPDRKVERFYRGEMLLSGGGDRFYRTRIEVCAPTQEDKAKKVYTVIESADNGIVGLDLLYEKARMDGADPPKIAPKEAYVREPGIRSVPSQHLALCPFLPFFKFFSCAERTSMCDPKGLTYLLTHAEEAWQSQWQLEGPDSSGIVRVSIPIQEDTSLTQVVELDMTKGAAIVNSSVYVDYKGPDDKPFLALRVDQLEQINGIWLPLHFTIERPGKRVCEVALHCEGVNEVLQPSDFSFNIPDGVTIHDEVAGTAYAATIPNELREQMLRQAVAKVEELRQPTSGSSPKTIEAAAIDSGDSPVGEPARVTTQTVLICLSVVFFAIAGTCLLLWRRSQRRTAS